MQWNDTSIVLSARKHGETSAIARVFSREHGVYAGVARGVQSKKMRGVVQSGNAVNAIWQARLSEQLGTFKIELLEPVAAFLMADAARLSALTSLCALLEYVLPERHPYPRLYGLFADYLQILKNDDHWQRAYIVFELELLAETGFGLDLTTCVATGEDNDLIYVSPKSGCAVSRDAGKPYHDRLLPLPHFLTSQKEKIPVESAEILEGMQLTGYFLEHWLLAPHNRKMPASRSRFVQIMKDYNGAKEDS